MTAQSNTVEYGKYLAAKSTTSATQSYDYDEFDEPVLVWEAEGPTPSFSQLRIFQNNDKIDLVYSNAQRGNATTVRAELIPGHMEHLTRDFIEETNLIIDVSIWGDKLLGGLSSEYAAYLTSAESPFESLYDAKSEFEKVTVLATSLRSLNFDFSDALADRIEAINEEVEDDPEGLVSASSLKAMIIFFANRQTILKPRVFLTNAGKFRAVWEDSPNRRFSLDFNSGEQVEFLIFAPTLGGTGSVKRVAGSGDIEFVMRTAEDMGALRWVLNEPG